MTQRLKCKRIHSTFVSIRYVCQRLYESFKDDYDDDEDENEYNWKKSHSLKTIELIIVHYRKKDTISFLSYCCFGYIHISVQNLFFDNQYKELFVKVG